MVQNRWIISLPARSVWVRNITHLVQVFNKSLHIIQRNQYINVPELPVQLVDIQGFSQVDSLEWNDRSDPGGKGIKDLRKTLPGAGQVLIMFDGSLHQLLLFLPGYQGVQAQLADHAEGECIEAVTPRMITERATGSVGQGAGWNFIPGICLNPEQLGEQIPLNLCSGKCAWYPFPDARSGSRGGQNSHDEL